MVMLSYVGQFFPWAFCYIRQLPLEPEGMATRRSKDELYTVPAITAIASFDRMTAGNGQELSAESLHEWPISPRLRCEQIVVTFQPLPPACLSSR